MEKKSSQTSKAPAKAQKSKPAGASSKRAAAGGETKSHRASKK